MALKKPVTILMVGPESGKESEQNTFTTSFMQHGFWGGFLVTYIPTRSSDRTVLEQLTYLISIIQIVFSLIYIKPEIMHLHMADKKSLMRKYTIYKISKIFRTKVIIHNYVPNFKTSYMATSLKNKKRLIEMLDDAERVIALDNSWKRLVYDKTQLKEAEVEFPEEKSKKANTSGSEFNILFFDSVVEKKGILDLIEASLPVIQEAVKQNKLIHFHIAGDGMLLELSKELVSAHGLNDFYRFHGPVTKDEKKELLKKADLFVIPSYYEEGLPKSLMESLSYGIPVISTDVGDVRKVIRHGGNGFLVEPGDITAMANCLHVSINIPFFNGWGKAAQKMPKDNFVQ